MLQREYPLEQHKIQTEDGYILTMHRIPYSPNNAAETADCKQKSRPMVLLQHGFALTSEAWVMLDRDYALAYQLADAGYDVWLGNQRGNEYSQQHASIDEQETDFWNFSFHELGYYDLAGMIDYMLKQTNNTAIHYVGYSQGTTVLMVLLSSRPEYQIKIKSANLMAPVVYMDNMKQPFVPLSSWVTSWGKWLLQWIGNKKVMHYNRFFMHRSFCQLMCGEGVAMNFVCRLLYSFVGGPGMQGINDAMLADVCLSHPAGVSAKQLLHFTQIHASGEFRQYDYGEVLNQLHYQQPQPPAYDITKISNCMHLYYGATDFLSDMLDVERLAGLLPCAVLRPIKAHDNHWNHYDFLFSHYARELVNKNILQVIKEKENWS